MNPIGWVCKKRRRRQPGNSEQQLFNDTRHHGLEVDVKRMRMENRHDFGGPWLGLQLVEQLGLKDFFDRTLPDGREKISWSRMALVLPFTVRKVVGTLIWLDQSRVDFGISLGLHGNAFSKGERKFLAGWWATVIRLIFVDWVPT